MSNSFFRFKQFEIKQDQTAMKVCTDACLLGAYTPVGKAERILDIGTGTGLLALMLAQRTEAGKIDAVEIEKLAYQQAQANVQASIFAGKITVHHLRIQDFLPTHKYDLIISNPPFYTQHLQSGKQAQDNALHTNTLPTAELVQNIIRLLLPEGTVWILLPPYQMELFTTEAHRQGLFPFHTLQVHSLPTKPLWRVIQGFSLQSQTPIVQTLSVSDSPQVYSEAFKALLKDYYLHL